MNLSFALFLLVQLCFLDAAVDANVLVNENFYCKKALVVMTLRIKLKHVPLVGNEYFFFVRAEIAFNLYF